MRPRESASASSRLSPGDRLLQAVFSSGARGAPPTTAPSSEVPHTRPPTPGSVHDRPHQQPRSRHPALERRPCELTSKRPREWPAGRLLLLPRRLAIARISQLSLEPLKGCDVFLGFLTPEESWEPQETPMPP